MTSCEIVCGDALAVLRTLPDASVHCCVTSPPYYGLRDYKVNGQIGLEQTPEEYVGKLVEVFREVRRVLRADGVLWLVLGDSYAGGGKGGGGSFEAERPGWSVRGRIAGHGLKRKDLIGIPWRVAFALQADGWWLRQDIIWSKLNPLPESVTDRCTRSHEYVFMLTKSARYYYDHEAIKEAAVSDHSSGNGYKRNERLTHQNADGTPRGSNRQWSGVGGTRNRRSVWTVPGGHYKEAHFATFPPKLIEPMILAGTSERGCCPKCEKPWQRVFVRTDTPDGSARGSRFDRGKTAARDGGNQTQRGERFLARPVGWRPGCGCGGEPVPCTVLDPFAGAGTTGLVALRNSRRAILVELNPDYCEMARKRIDRSVNAKPLPFPI